MASSTLFPPVVQSIQPAFDITENTVKVYFSLSSFNSYSDVKQVQVSARYQTNNNNALSSTYTNAILAAEISQSSDIEKEKYAPYYIEISKSDLSRGFVDQQIIKIQLRNSSVSSIKAPTADWLNANKNNFSEWSTVTLLRGIVAPEFTIPTLESDSTDVVFPSGEALFLGSFYQGGSNETLRYWRIQLYNEKKDTLLADSGEQIYNNNDYIKNEDGSIGFECKLPYEMSDEEKYHLTASIETRNGYIIIKEYDFTTLSYSDKTLDATLEIEKVPDEGYFNIKIKSTTGIVAHTGVILRRTDAKSNFTVWEDIAGKTFANSVIDWEWQDFTAQSGVYYQYAMQSVDNYSHRGQLQKSEVVMMEYEDSFLYEKGQQLKLKYNFNISTLNTKVNEQVIETIGDRYAHILRDGEIYYRTFSFSGLITQLMDSDAHQFVTRDKVLDNQTARWQAFRAEDKKWRTYDYTAERNFRQYVEDFLYDGNIKLFKSLQEGNIIVKLDASSISLTPKSELGRLMYEFSATAYEVAAADINNYIALNFISDPATDLTEISFNESRLGRLNGADMTIPARRNILNLISEKYNVGETHNGIRVEDFTLSHLRIEFDSEPYLIDLSSGIPRPLDDDNTDGTQETPSNNMIVGHLIQIGDTVVVIPSPHNTYEMKGDDITILSNQVIAPLKDAIINVDFIINLQESEDLGEVATTTTYTRINGQVWDTFDVDDDVYARIFTKYFVEKPTYYINLAAILTVNIEAPIGSEFSVKYSNGESEDFIIGETGELLIDPIDRTIAITSLKFKQKTDAIVNYYIQTVKGVY